MLTKMHVGFSIEIFSSKHEYSFNHTKTEYTKYSICAIQEEKFKTTFTCLAISKTSSFCSLKNGGNNWLNSDTVNLLKQTKEKKNHFFL